MLNAVLGETSGAIPISGPRPTRPGLVCFLLVTKPLTGYTFLQSTATTRTSGVYFRRNEERQFHGKDPRCFVDDFDTFLHGQQRSDQHVRGARTFPIPAYSTYQRRIPIKERPILPRQISQILTPPAATSSIASKVIYFTTPTPLVAHKFHNQGITPSLLVSSEFKPQQLLVNSVPPVSSAHKTSIISTTVSPIVSLGSYSTDSLQPHTEKKTGPFSNSITNSFHASAHHGKFQQNVAVTVSRPINVNHPASTLRPSPLKPLAPVSADYNKETQYANSVSPPNVPKRFQSQSSPTRPPQQKYVSVPLVDSGETEIYHKAKPVTENVSDSNLDLLIKSGNNRNSSQHKREDLKTSSNDLGYFYPGVQTTGPLGHLGLGPYSHAEHHKPIANSLLISNTWNPPLGIGLGGAANVHYRYSPQNYGGDPVVNLLLKTYGKYLPYGLGSYGLYSYSAPSNIDNSKPFGLYKYEDRL